MIAKVLTIAALAALAAGPVLAQGGARTVNDGVYTAAQAERGKAVYADGCANCHGADLSGGGGGPAVTGPFWSAWAGRSMGELFALTKGSMPMDGPGRLSDAEYADVLAYMLSVNRLPPGATELPADADALGVIAIVARN